MNGKQCIQRLDALKTERSNLDATYDLIDRFVVPGRGRLYDGKTGGENGVDWRRRELLDSTALQSAQTLAASINGSLTSPSTRWWSWRFRSVDRNEDTEFSRWLQRCQEIAFNSIYDSNFSVEASEYYLDAVTFGTPIITHEYEKVGGKPVMRYKTLETRSFWFETDFAGKLIGLYREEEYTAAQIMLEFDNVPKNIQDAYNNPSHVEPFEVVHVVYLDRDAYEKYKGADRTKKVPPQNRPYQEKYVLKTSAEELIPKTPNGYYEMPAYLLRWGRTAGSKYGYSPAMNAMPDVLMLNQLKELDIRAREKAVDPPLLTQMRGVFGNVDLKAGGVTNVRSMDMVTPLESRARFDVSETLIGMLVSSIRSLFFVDQLELKDSPAMTATEVNVRYELMQRLLGPTLARFKTDFLDPMLTRTFWILYREGAFPPPPEGLDVTDIEIDYVGPMARNQRMDEVVAIERVVQAMNIMGPLDEEVLDAFDWPEAAKVMADVLGAPARIKRSKAEIKKRLDERNAMKQKAMQQEHMQGMASAMRDGAQGAKYLQDAGVDMGGMMG